MDAVVCDPPYGVRAGGRKSQSNPECKIRDRTTHITSTAPYFLGQQHLLPQCLMVAVPSMLIFSGHLLNWGPACRAFNRQE